MIILFLILLEVFISEVVSRKDSGAVNFGFRGGIAAVVIFNRRN